MGDFFRHLVDVEATASEAPALADGLTRWLVDLGVIEASTSDCVLGREDGHPPGPNYSWATGNVRDETMIGLKTNGVEVVTVPTVFNAGQGNHLVLCPRCGTGMAWEVITSAIDEWWSQRGEGVRVCRACSLRFSLNEWDWRPPWGFGNLGLTFWNWPPLSGSFMHAVRVRLRHRCVYVDGKL